MATSPTAHPAVSADDGRGHRLPRRAVDDVPRLPGGRHGVPRRVEVFAR